MNLHRLTLALFLTFLSTTVSLQVAAPAWLSNTSEQNAKFDELTCVTAMGDGGFCAVQKNGMLYLSKDGHTWEEKNNSGSTNLLCADFYDRDNGVVAGVNTSSWLDVLYS